MSEVIKLIPGLPTGATVQERIEHGREARKRLPRKAFADWSPPADRPSAVDLLTSQEGTRVPMLVPVRHARMAVSPFTFYRGAAIVMASDLGQSPNTDLWAQLCGDAHLSNFGAFGSAERNLVFDVNDFDETSPGPFEWDLMRLAASFILAGRDNQIPDSESKDFATTAALAYQKVMMVAAERPNLANWYTVFTPEQILDYAQTMLDTKQLQKTRKRLDLTVQKAKSRDTWSAIKKLTEVGPTGQRRFLNQPPLLVRVADLPQAAGIKEGMFEALSTTFEQTLGYDRQALLQRYRLIDVAHKVVGVGSVGLPALIGLLQGRDDDDLMVLQFKAAEASVLEKWTRPSPFSEHGQRVVVGQRLMQSSGDPFLGWVTGPRGVHFYGRQLRDFKFSVDLNGLKRGQFVGYAALCGATLAMAHARAGDPIALSAYMGKGKSFPNAIAQFAITYANLTDEDYKEFTTAIADGKLAVDDGTTADAGLVNVTPSDDDDDVTKQDVVEGDSAEPSAASAADTLAADAEGKAASTDGPGS